MGLVVLRKGDIVFESYPCMRDHEMPVHWSVAKVFQVVCTDSRGARPSRRYEAYRFYPGRIVEFSFGRQVRNLLDMASGHGDQYVSGILVITNIDSWETDIGVKVIPKIPTNF